MTMRKHRGNNIEYDHTNDKWLYSDTKQPVPINYKTRPCGNCGRDYTEEGHDGCMGTLMGLMNACCGHGNDNEAYIQFLDGEVVRGEDATIIQNILKKYKQLE